MIIEIDLRVLPPATTLLEADDFTAFKVVVREAEHARVSVAAIEALAGERAGDPQWREGLEKMLAYAQSHGWVDDVGVRAHIERTG